MTIDGVAASGKSSVASGVARALHVPFVSSGLLYRAVARAALNANLPLNDEAALVQHLGGRPLRLDPRAEGNHAYQGDTDLTPDLHTDEVDDAVSAVASLPGVRAWVDAHLRTLPAPFVAEGRDMGTNVFPEAEAKFYLTASPRVRAQRRAGERTADLDAVEAALQERDRRDARQSQPATDAHIIDTGNLDLQGVINLILSHIQAARA